MTGWRIGWMVVPERLVRPMERLAQNLYISPPYLSQVAALAAFDAAEELEAVKAGYARNRAMLLEELPRLGLGEMHPVDGAFYIYADVARFTNDSVGLLQAPARRSRRRRDARSRFRSARGSAPPAPVLRGIRSGLPRGFAPPQRLAHVLTLPLRISAVAEIRLIGCASRKHPTCVWGERGVGAFLMSR